MGVTAPELSSMEAASLSILVSFCGLYKQFSVYIFLAQITVSCDS